MSGRFDMVNCDRYRAACKQNETFDCSIVVKDPLTKQPRDLTGYTSAMQVRSSPESTTVVLPLTVTVTPLTGTLNAVASATLTAALTPGMYVYDWFLTSPTGVSVCELEGRFEVTSRVTR